MYKQYGVHKKIWNKYKALVENKNFDNIDLKKNFDLSSKQIWFLFDKLLQGKYNHLYKRDLMNRDKLRLNDYVHCKEYGRGKITYLFENDFMLVKFESKKLPIMCNKGGYTVHDNQKRIITKL